MEEKEHAKSSSSEEKGKEKGEGGGGEKGGEASPSPSSFFGGLFGGETEGGAASSSASGKATHEEHHHGKGDKKGDAEEGHSSLIESLFGFGGGEEGKGAGAGKAAAPNPAAPKAEASSSSSSSSAAKAGGKKHHHFSPAAESTESSEPSSSFFGGLFSSGGAEGKTEAASSTSSSSKESAPSKHHSKADHHAKGADGVAKKGEGGEEHATLMQSLFGLGGGGGAAEGAAAGKDGKGAAGAKVHQHKHNSSSSSKGSTGSGEEKGTEGGSSSSFFGGLFGEAAPASDPPKGAGEQSASAESTKKKGGKGEHASLLENLFGVGGMEEGAGAAAKEESGKAALSSSSSSGGGASQEAGKHSGDPQSGKAEKGKDSGGGGEGGGWFTGLLGGAAAGAGAAAEGGGESGGAPAGKSGAAPTTAAKQNGLSSAGEGAGRGEGAGEGAAPSPKAEAASTRGGLFGGSAAGAAASSSSGSASASGSGSGTGAIGSASGAGAQAAPSGAAGGGGSSAYKAKRSPPPPPPQRKSYPAAEKARKGPSSSPLEDRLLDSLTPKQSYTPFIIFGVLLLVAAACAFVWFAFPSVKCKLFKICPADEPTCPSPGPSTCENPLTYYEAEEDSEISICDSDVTKHQYQKCVGNSGEYYCAKNLVCEPECTGTPCEATNIFKCNYADNCKDCPPAQPTPEPCYNQSHVNRYSLCVLDTKEPNCKPFATSPTRSTEESNFYTQLTRQYKHTRIGYVVPSSTPISDERCVDITAVKVETLGVPTNQPNVVICNTAGYNAMDVTPPPNERNSASCDEIFPASGCCKSALCQDAEWRCAPEPTAFADGKCYSAPSTTPLAPNVDTCCVEGSTSSSGICCPSSQSWQTQEGKRVCTRYRSDYPILMPTSSGDGDGAPSTPECGKAWFDAFIPKWTHGPSSKWNFYDPSSTQIPDAHSIYLETPATGKDGCHFIGSGSNSKINQSEIQALGYRCDATNAVCEAVDVSGQCQKYDVEEYSPIQYAGGTPVICKNTSDENTSRKNYLYWKPYKDEDEEDEENEEVENYQALVTTRLDCSGAADKDPDCPTLLDYVFTEGEEGLYTKTPEEGPGRFKCTQTYNCYNTFATPNPNEIAIGFNIAEDLLDQIKGNGDAGITTQSHSVINDLCLGIAVNGACWQNPTSCPDWTDWTIAPEVWGELDTEFNQKNSYEYHPYPTPAENHPLKYVDFNVGVPVNTPQPPINKLQGVISYCLGGSDPTTCTQSPQDITLPQNARGKLCEINTKRVDVSGLRGINFSGSFVPGGGDFMIAQAKDASRLPKYLSNGRYCVGGSAYDGKHCIGDIGIGDSQKL